MDLSKFSGYPHVAKQWGTEIWLTNNPLYCAKLLVLKPGMACSLHRHIAKTETFFILQGEVRVEIGTHGLPEYKHPGDSVHLPAGTFHRFADPGGSNVPAIILEVSTEHDDADVERLASSGPANNICQ
jgi:mannose-6-phosphate isomerase-like protein (cupin superfamily)